MDKLTDIWRVENPAGEGPYSPKSRIAQTLREIPEGQAPLPMQDRGLCGIFGRSAVYPGYSFGFASLESYQAWFSRVEHREALDKEGYFLARYQVSAAHICHGSMQIMFKKAAATRVDMQRCTLLATQDNAMSGLGAARCVNIKEP